MRRSRLFAVVAFAFVELVPLLAHAPAIARSTEAPFVTSARPFLVPLAQGVTVQPILTTGDVIGTGKGAYQMSGVPDGLGWYESAPGTFELYMNHELNAAFDPSAARVSHLTLDVNGAVTAADYLVDGTEEYEWFCSSTLTVIGGVPWYTTGEESKHSPRRGATVVYNAASGRLTEAPWFGHFGHENVVPVLGLSKAYLGLSEDGFSEESQLFAYQAAGFNDAFHGRSGGLRVWVPDHRVPDGNPSANDIAKGDSVEGHFELVRNARNLLPLQLEKSVQAMGAWDFVRIEDQVADPNAPGTIYFSETGRANSEDTHGRIYRLDVDPARPRHASLSVVLDSKSDDLVQPDNLGISDTALVIQEDRNWKRSGYNRVLVYDLSSGDLTPVARTDPKQAIIDERGPGAWESSGVVDASDAFGPGMWLLDVQAHYTEMPVPDLTVVPGSAKGEGGQLELVFIPGT
jgi:hypothetical protein